MPVQPALSSGMASFLTQSEPTLILHHFTRWKLSGSSSCFFWVFFVHVYWINHISTDGYRITFNKFGLFFSPLLLTSLYSIFIQSSLSLAWMLASLSRSTSICHSEKNSQHWIFELNWLIVCNSKNNAPHSNLGVDDTGTGTIVLNLIAIFPMVHALPFYPFCGDKKKIVRLVLPPEFRPQRLFTREKCEAMTLLNDSRLTVFSFGSWSPSLSLPLHLAVPSIAHLSRSLPWAGHFVLVLAVSSSSSSSLPSLSSSSSLPGPSVGDKLFVGMHWRPRAAHSCTQRTSIDPACGST